MHCIGADHWCIPSVPVDLVVPAALVVLVVPAGLADPVDLVVPAGPVGLAVPADLADPAVMKATHPTVFQYSWSGLRCRFV